MIIGAQVSARGDWVRLQVFLTLSDEGTPHFCGELTLLVEEWRYLETRLKAWQIGPDAADLNVILTSGRARTEDKPS